MLIFRAWATCVEISEIQLILASAPAGLIEVSAE